MIFGIAKAEKLVKGLAADALLDPPEERWTYKLVPMPCGTRAKIEVRDEEGYFVAYMGEDLPPNAYTQQVEMMNAKGPKEKTNVENI